MKNNENPIRNKDNKQSDCVIFFSNSKVYYKALSQAGSFAKNVYQTFFTLRPLASYLFSLFLARNLFLELPLTLSKDLQALKIIFTVRKKIKSTTVLIHYKNMNFKTTYK